MTGVKYGGDSLSYAPMTKRQGPSEGGDNLSVLGVTPGADGGDIALSPKPSLTIKEDPSVKEILDFWVEKFPDKPQPRSTTNKLKDKVRARIKDRHFQENWQEALEIASESITCQKESWFNLYFFLHNEVNYQKCLDRWMSWKDVQDYGENGSEEIDMQEVRAKEAQETRERIAKGKKVKG